ncbi:hypothetical protein SAMN04487764_3043 [Gillisia sp. Hel1_33_143]|uniref:hypothetical protein n=1 Tax=Gillisia sp. Hel1_33_143 TaxID=1336796 RepID=UPI00087B34A2|nr:hypothetical protein [Gillisia sp. Hel1_33_143]SDS78101.1 hypothetical protein SAMN04487764_3043 [Gillisia sp. Hel1_33_143]
MKNEVNNFRYLEWKTPEEMHFSSLEWISELNFINDEHSFFEDMLKEYTLPIIEFHLTEKVTDLIKKLSTTSSTASNLHKDIQDHINGLEVMLDGKDNIKKETQYKEAHRNLLTEFFKFSRNYNRLKKEIFKTVSEALKHQKQKRLLQ